VRSSAVPPPVTTVMETAGAWLPERLGIVEKRLAEVAAGHGPELGSEAEATLAAGGKRLRPLLVLICAGPPGKPNGRPDRAVTAAVAIELIHMATLVHDDVLDGAPVRRGRPTVVARSGRDAAVGVGDLLFSRAFAELAAAGGEAEVAELSSASGALAQGELAQRRDAYDTGVGEDRYFERCTLKTARLFEAACRVGRLAAGAPGAGRLAGFGREIGLAFQLLDDVLDVTGPPERTGKARGTDLLDGTVNLPLIVAMRLEPALAEIDLRSLDAAGAEALCDRIAATGALDEVRDRARAGIARAKAELETDDFTPSERDLLGLIADGVVERYS
jgi:geranylgeranyl pyrophosphate synthase